MLHVWLVPALVILFLGLCGFYLLIKFTGGSGERTEGRTVVNKPEPEEPSLPASKNTSKEQP